MGSGALPGHNVGPQEDHRRSTGWNRCRPWMDPVALQEMPRRASGLPRRTRGIHRWRPWINPIGRGRRHALSSTPWTQSYIRGNAAYRTIPVRLQRRQWGSTRAAPQRHKRSVLRLQEQSATVTRVVLCGYKSGAVRLQVPRGHRIDPNPSDSKGSSPELEHHLRDHRPAVHTRSGSAFRSPPSGRRSWPSRAAGAPT